MSSIYNMLELLEERISNLEEITKLLAPKEEYKQLVCILCAHYRPPIFSFLPGKLGKDLCTYNKKVLEDNITIFVSTPEWCPLLGEDG